MPTIPISSQRVKHSRTRYGYIFAHEYTIAVVAVFAVDGSITLTQHEGAQVLGEWLKYESQKLSKAQVETLLKKGTVTLNANQA